MHHELKHVGFAAPRTTSLAYSRKLFAAFLPLLLASLSVSVTHAESSSPSKLPSGSQDSVVAATVSGLPAHLVSVPTKSDYYLPYIFVVDKTARSLEIWKSEIAADGKRQFIRFAAYPADLGRSTGAKISEGDHKTPEGIYFLQNRLEGASLDFKLYGSRAYTTDYPNHFDDLDGKSGSGIWLHAVPDNVALTRGSRGCVVVRNDIIKTLDPYIHLGRTPIIISEKIEKRSIGEMEASQAKLEKWLESWRNTWETKSLDEYMKFYDEDFKAMGMNKAAWREYKAKLGKLYTSINVRISEPMAFEHRGRAIVRFVQSYSSNQMSDLGEKTLHLVTRNGEWKILSETWRADNSASARAAVAPEPAAPTKTAGL